MESVKACGILLLCSVSVGLSQDINLPTYTGMAEIPHRFFPGASWKQDLGQDACSKECIENNKDGCLAFQWCQTPFNQQRTCQLWLGKNQGATFSPSPDDAEWQNCTVYYYIPQPTLQVAQPQYNAQVEYKFSTAIQDNTQDVDYINLIENFDGDVYFDAGDKDKTNGKTKITGYMSILDDVPQAYTLIVNEDFGTDGEWILIRDDCKVLTPKDNAIELVGIQFQLDALDLSVLDPDYPSYKKLTYLGSTMYREMHADVWTVDVKTIGSEVLDSGVRYYYFTKPEFFGDAASSRGEFTAPLLVVTMGRLNTKESLVGPPGATFSQSYDFFKFETYTEKYVDITVYEPPPMAVCEGRQIQRQMPKQADQFSLSGQVISTTLGILPQQIQSVIEITYIYDGVNKIDRTDYFLSNQTNIYNLSGPVTIIHDFPNDLAFVIEVRTGRCKATKIEDDVITFVDHDGSTMIKPQAMAYFDSATWVYSGRRKHHDLTVDVWGAKVSKFKINHFGTMVETEATVEYSFPAANLSAEDYYILMENKEGALAAESVAFYNDTLYRTRTEYSRRSRGQPSFRAYRRVRTCFVKDEVADLELVFDANPKLIEFHPMWFEQQLQAALATATGTSPIRFQRIILNTNCGSGCARAIIQVSEQIPKARQSPHLARNPPTAPVVTLADLLDRLEQAVKDGKVDLSNLGFGTIKARSMKRDVFAGGDTTTTSGLSSGGAAALALGMIVLGAALAIGAIFIFTKVLGKELPFQKMT